jgi:hypothetical protein
VTELKSALEKADKTEIETKTEALSDALQKIGEIMQKAASEQSAEEKPKEQKWESDVRDAEVTKDDTEEGK